MILKKLFTDFLYTEIWRFAIVGGIATMVLYGTYWGMVKWINPTISYSLAYFCAFVVNYILTTSFTFKVKKTVINGMGFIVSNIINYLISVGLLNLFIYMGLSTEIAPIPTIFLATLSNFFIVRLVMKKI